MENSKYIIVTENSEIFQTDHITNSEEDAADDGILDIIDMKNFTQYYEGEWHELKSWTTGE